ncbi:recombinase family protein [Zoogloea sp. LCSB751]|uniref:recombinase family protein n=1 Tax=Zoogloea sp. LCSB751 TaxID=1965277 RepID=UPI0020B16F82|nr:recombinase family protein [Zoogloea sp. LCSB751]
MRIAIYARFSTDRQRETSLEDQARVCQTYAQSRGWPAAHAMYSDEGTSGTTPVIQRQGGARLITDALAGRFEVLIVEGLDRLSRDQVEQERTVRRLEHRGIHIIGVADGYDSESAGRKIHRTMRGLINEIYLDDLRHKTHRGLAGQLSRGGHAGGLSYGYRSVPAGEIHKLEIVEAEAEHVRWIYAQYADGWSCQRIAADLNVRGIKTGRGSTWAVSALYGSPAKGSGMLCNEIYRGRLIWNRSQWVKDPDSGKRIRTERPQDEWYVEERPELRIVSDELWSAVRSRMGRPTGQGGSSGHGCQPRTLFGGLLRCGFCGGAVVATSARHYGCVARKDRGESVCRGVTAFRKDVDAALLNAIREELMTPASLEILKASVGEILEDRQRSIRSHATSSSGRRKELDAEIQRLVDAIAAVGISPALRDRLQQAESELAQLIAIQSVGVPQQTISAEAVLTRYPKAFEDLASMLQSDVQKAREHLRRLIGRPVLRAEAGDVLLETWAGRYVLPGKKQPNDQH